MHTPVAQSAACKPVPSGFHHSLAIKRRSWGYEYIGPFSSWWEMPLCIPSLFLVLSEEGESQVRLEPWCVLLWRDQWIEGDAFWHVSSRNVWSDGSANSPAHTAASSAFASLPARNGGAQLPPVSEVARTFWNKWLWTGGSRRQNSTVPVFQKSGRKSREKTPTLAIRSGFRVFSPLPDRGVWLRRELLGGCPHTQL